MSLPITRVGPLNVLMKPIFTVCWPPAGAAPSATSAAVPMRSLFMSAVLQDGERSRNADISGSGRQPKGLPTVSFRPSAALMDRPRSAIACPACPQLACRQSLRWLGTGSKAFLGLLFSIGVVMHELSGRTHWHEPTGNDRAGFGEFGRPKTPYDLFMESEGITIYRDIGVSKVQNLPLAPWKRLGGKGTYIQLHGTEGKWGSYVVEVPGAGALGAERNPHEEIHLVGDGRGTTEVWLENDKKRHVFY